MSKKITTLDIGSDVLIQFELDFGIYPIGIKEIKKYNRGKRYKQYNINDCIMISYLFYFLKNEWVEE
jgi:hypothetical protein